MLVFWLGEAIIDAYQFPERGISEALFPRSPIELILKLALALGMFLFWIRLQVLVNRQKLLEEELRKNEQQLKEYSGTLEQRVRERTEDIEAAKAREVALNKVKSEFLANMGHELRTPLNSIIGFTNVIRDQTYGVLNEKQKEYVEYIRISGTHLLELINEILDFTKIESGHEELRKTRFPLESLVNLTVSLFREKAAEKKLALTVNIDPTACIEIEADQCKLKQILNKLLSNAIKFTTKQGEIAVSVRKTGENEIELSVEDTGIGIRPEDMDKLFKPFTQISSSYSREFQGTGLGLSVTKSLVEQHKGSIRVESEYGKGSRFIVTLPISEPEKPQEGLYNGKN